MVASSRSSIRRPASRNGDHTTSRSSSVGPSDTPGKLVQQPPRPKRSRVSSISDRGQLQKRRRLAGKLKYDDIQIPLRGKDNGSKGILPAVVTRPVMVIDHVTQNSTNTSSPLESPSIKPQYDQIKRIEEKARAAINGDGSNSSKKDDRRKLRSEHGGSRSKTELAQYFPNFDEMLSLEPIAPDILTAKTQIVLVNDTPDFRPPARRSDPFGALKPLHKVTYLPPVFFAGRSTSDTHDPLGPDVYYKIHRKAERHEKQIKNGDKEKAQHEKYQLERLLDELRGPDWLKTLGITGVTDTEKRRYEPKRALFVRETKALIDKFKRWKEEEKRRKLEKEQQTLEEAAEREEGAEGEGMAEAAASTSTRKRQGRVKQRTVSRTRSSSPSEQGEESSEVIDELASQQLLQEAKSANVSRRRIVPSELPIVLPEVYKPFTSFFSKRHIRDAAVAGRQRGRTILAFGEAVPDLDDTEFELPESILTEDAIRASQRNRRRTNRGVNEGSM